MESNEYTTGRSGRSSPVSADGQTGRPVERQLTPQKKKRNTAKTAKTAPKNRRSPVNSGSRNVRTGSVQAISPERSILNIPLNPDTARQAIILSEVIGRPVSKRGRRG